MRNWEFSVPEQGNDRGNRLKTTDFPGSFIEWGTAVEELKALTASR